jgi:hypothetical protein
MSPNYYNGGFMKEIDAEWLKQQYCVEGVTQRRIAEVLGCSQAWVHHLCENYNLQPPQRPSKNRIDLTGKEIGDLVVLSYAYTIKKTPFWLCKCKCGSVKHINGKHLKKAKITSCGCKRNKQSPRRTGYKEIPGNHLQSIKLKAAKRNLEFTISDKEIWDIYLEQNKKCALSGIAIDFPLNQNKKYRSCQTASLDRIDSSKGYVTGNVQWVHKHINLMKQDLLNEEFIDWCKKVVDHHT